MTDLLASGNLGGSCRVDDPWPTLGGRGGDCGLLLVGRGGGGAEGVVLGAEGVVLGAEGCWVLLVSTNSEGLFLLGVILEGEDSDTGCGEVNIEECGVPGREGLRLGT